MRHFVLTLLLAASATGAFALNDNYVKLDMSRATTTQSHLSNNGDIAPANAIDGVYTGKMAGWNNGELKKADGTTADNNSLDSGANWWAVDLGDTQSIDAIKIKFEGAFSKSFDIEFYNDATFSTPVESINVTNGTTDFEYVFTDSKQYRYMRLNFLEATNHTWGIKFYEIDLMRDLVRAGASSAGLVADITGAATIVKGLPATLTAYIKDADGKILGSSDNFILSSDDQSISIDGNKITANATGTFELTLTVGGLTFPVTVNVIAPISDMTCLVYSDGPWKAAVSSIYPTPVTTPEAIVDQDETNAGGWADGKLGGSNTINKGDAWLTIDLRRPCNISAIKAINSGAVINGYTIVFYDSDPDTGLEVSPIFSLDYSTKNTADNSTEEIYLPKTVNARYVKVLITSLYNHAWGGRFRELCFYGPDNASLQLDRIIMNDNKAVVGRTSYIKVQAVTPEGLIIYDNLDAKFTFGQNADAIRLGDKTADGYAMTGLSEAVVPVTFTANPRGDNEMTGTGNIIVASPLDQHVCLINHITNKLSVAHQYNPVEPYNADNAINGIDNNSYFKAGWSAADLATENGELDQHANWWTVDLGRTANVEAVRVTWPAEYASRYKIELFGADVKLWEDYRTDPAAADDKAIYTQIVDYSGKPEAHTDLIRFDRVVEGARSMRLTMLDAAGNDGIQIYEVCLLGRDNPDFTINQLALVRKDVNVGENAPTRSMV